MKKNLKYMETGRIYCNLQPNQDKLVDISLYSFNYFIFMCDNCV